MKRIVIFHPKLWKFLFLFLGLSPVVSFLLLERQQRLTFKAKILSDSLLKPLYFRNQL